MRIVKRIFIGLGILVLLVVIMAALAPFLFKKQIVEQVKKVANKHLTAKVDFDNDVSISIFRSFPNLTVTIKDIQVVNTGAFEGDTLVRLKSLDVKVDIMSVINNSQGYKIKHIGLEDGKIYAHVNDSGLANWDIVKPSTDTTVVVDTSEPAPMNLKLSLYELKGLDVEYIDEQGDMELNIKQLNHTGKGNFAATLFDLNTDTDIEEFTFRIGPAYYMSRVQTKLNAIISMDMDKMRFEFKDNELDLNALRMGFTGWVTLQDSAIDMDLKLGLKEAAFKDVLSLIPAIFMNDFKDLKSEGMVTLDGFAKGKYVGEEYPAFGMNLLVKDGMMQYPSLPTALKDVQMETTVAFPGGDDLDQLKVDIKRLHVNLGGDVVDAKMKLTQLISNPDVDLEVAGKLDLSRVKTLVQMDKNMQLGGKVAANATIRGNMANFEAQNFGAVYAKGDVTVDNLQYAGPQITKPLKIQKAVLKLDPKAITMDVKQLGIASTLLDAQGDLTHYMAYMLKGKTLVGNLKTNIDLLNLNELLNLQPAAAPSSTPVATTPAPSKPDEIKKGGNIGLPENITFNAQATIGKLIYDTYVIDNVKGAITLEDKILELRGLDLDFLGAHLMMSGKIDDQVKNGLVAHDIVFKIKNMGFKAIYKGLAVAQQYAPIMQYIDGSFDAEMEFDAPLDEDYMPMISKITSSGFLSIAKATLRDYPALKEIASTINRKEFAMLTSSIDAKQFETVEIKGIRPSYYITDGRVHLKDPVKFTVANVKSEVIGSTGLDQTLDYKMSMVVPTGNAGSEANKALGTLSGGKLKTSLGKTVNVLADIGGTSSKPTVKLNVGAIAGDLIKDLKDQAVDEFNKKKAELEAEARKRVEDEKAKLRAKAEAEKKELEDKLNAEKDKAKEKLEAEKKRLEEEKRKAEEEAKRKIEEEKAKAKEDLKKKGKDLFKR